MDELLFELDEVTNWFELGIYLGVPPSQLQEIHQEFDDIQECKIEMLLAWRQQGIPTWNSLVSALTSIGMQSLATKIASKYSELNSSLLLLQHAPHIPTLDIEMFVTYVLTGVPIPSSTETIVKKLETEQVYHNYKQNCVCFWTVYMHACVTRGHRK